VDAVLVAALVAVLQRRMAFALSVTSGHLYLTLGERVIDGAVQRYAWQDAGA
jgi:hypothetical protein